MLSCAACYLGQVVLRVAWVLSDFRCGADLTDWNCRGMRIHILDLNKIAAERGFPQCVAEDKVVVDARLGVPYLQIDEHHPDLRSRRPAYYSVHHQYGMNSSPWLFAQACLPLCFKLQRCLKLAFIQEQCPLANQQQLRWCATGQHQAC